jgi:hypothetical protein
MKKRIFIVAPNYEGDKIHHVCSTTSKKSLSDIYVSDNYEIEGTYLTMRGAKNKSKRMGSKRTTVI